MWAAQCLQPSVTAVECALKLCFWNPNVRNGSKADFAVAVTHDIFTLLS